MKCNKCAKQFLCKRKECKFKSFREIKNYGVPRRIKECSKETK